MCTEPADVPFIAAFVAVAVNVHAHFNAVDVSASAAGFQLHCSPSS
jgi:hypothetical protein